MSSSITKQMCFQTARVVALLLAFSPSGVASALPSGMAQRQASLHRAHPTEQVTTNTGLAHRNHANNVEEAAAKLALQAEELANRALKLKRNILQRNKVMLMQTVAHVSKDLARKNLVSKDFSNNLWAESTGSIIPDIFSIVSGPMSNSVITSKQEFANSLSNLTNRWLAPDFLSDEVHSSQEEKNLKEASALVSAALAAVR